MNNIVNKYINESLNVHNVGEKLGYYVSQYWDSSDYDRWENMSDKKQLKMLDDDFEYFVEEYIEDTDNKVKDKDSTTKWFMKNKKKILPLIVVS